MMIKKINPRVSFIELDKLENGELCQMTKYGRLLRVAYFDSVVVRYAEVGKGLLEYVEINQVDYPIVLH